MSAAIIKLDPSVQQLTVERARDLLAECISIHPAKFLRDQAKVFSVFLRERNASVESQNLALEIARRAERRMGELLAEMPKAEGELLRGTQQEPRETSVPTLAEQGISKKESATWQAMAKLPESVFEERVSELKNAQEPITPTAILRTGRRGKRRVDQEQRKADVLRLHNEGLCAEEIAEELQIDPATISKIKVDLSIASVSPPLKIWKDIEHVATSLGGAIPQLEKLATELATVSLNATQEEIKSCIKQLSKATAAIRRLSIELRKTQSQT